MLPNMEGRGLRRQKKKVGEKEREKTERKRRVRKGEGRKREGRKERERRVEEQGGGYSDVSGKEARWGWGMDKLGAGNG